MKISFAIKSTVFALFLFSFMSCESTRQYTRTTDKHYEDGVLTYVEYKDVYNKELSDGTKKPETKKEYSELYYDFSNAGYIETDSKVFLTGEKGDRRCSGQWTAHSFVAKKLISSENENIEVTYSLVETVFSEVVKEDGDDVSATQDYKTSVIGNKIFYVGDNGKIVSDGGKFHGDDFSAEDEEFFENVLALTLPIILDANGGTDIATKSVLEEENTSYKTKETFDNITVKSYPDQNYIMYSIFGKPFVIAGCTAWNFVKCVGYACINFAGGYQLVTGGNGWGPHKDEYWLMPSFKTAHRKFEEAKEKNAIEHYPEYHLPFTDNTIIIEGSVQESADAYLTPENSHVTRSYREEIPNELSVARSAAADAAYTAGVVGVIGTGVTIPVGVVSWIGGAAAGIASQMKN